MPRILYKYPSRQRPHKLFPSLDRFFNLVRHWDFMLVVTLDEDDETMQTAMSQEAWYAYSEYYPEYIKVNYGHSDGKVHAINRNMSEYADWDILVLLSDDMELQPGFDAEILKAFEDGFSGLVHFPDGIVNERLCTFSVMDKSYFDLFGYIYNPVYTSVYCDQEQHAIAVMLDRYKYVPANIVKHLHPAYGMAPSDDLYRRNENMILYAEDRNTYHQRARNNFYIINPKKCNPFLVS